MSPDDRSPAAAASQEDRRHACAAAASSTALLPADLRALLEALQAADDHAVRLAEELTDEQFTWRPDPRGWSVGQCLDHVARTNELYVAAMRPGLEAARRRAQPYRAIRPGWLARWFLKQLEPPVRVRVRAPRRVKPAGDERDERDGGIADASHGRTQVRDAFLRAQRTVRDLVHETAIVDPNGTRFANPFIRGIDWTLGAGLLIIAAHERRHLWQAEQVRARPDFPGPRA